MKKNVDRLLILDGELPTFAHLQFYKRSSRDFIEINPRPKITKAPAHSHVPNIKNETRKKSARKNYLPRNQDVARENP